jgi:hypothetical protein
MSAIREQQHPTAESDLQQTVCHPERMVADSGEEQPDRRIGKGARIMVGDRWYLTS